MEERKSYTLIILIATLLILGGVFYMITNGINKRIIPGQTKTGQTGIFEKNSLSSLNPFAKPTVIKEELKIPVTKKLTVTSGRTVAMSEGAVATPLVPKSDGQKIIVPLATYSVQGAYEFSLKQAQIWKSDARLAFIKSLGALTLEGKSSQWQVVFVSNAAPKVSYEIIVQGDAAVSKKEVSGSSPAGALPKTWFDSDEALRRLAAIPQFANVTVSAINFFYNPDAKLWRYAIATSVGTTSLEL